MFNLPKNITIDNDDVRTVQNNNKLSHSLKNERNNSLNSARRIQPVINTPFTSSRYRHHSVGTRPYNLGSPRSTSKTSSINSRLAEVKRLVKAGVVKQDVYDKLVGANKSIIHNKEETRVLNNEPASDKEKDHNQQQQQDDTYSTTSTIVPASRNRSSSLTNGSTRTTSKLSNNKLSRHESRHTLVGLPGEAMLSSAKTLPQKEKDIVNINNNSGNGWFKVKSFLRINSRRPTTSTQGSPLDLPVVAQKMLNYNLTMTKTEKAADVNGSVYTMFVMVMFSPPHFIYLLYNNNNSNTLLFLSLTHFS
jgi:hypothetical protein